LKTSRLSATVTIRDRQKADTRRRLVETAFRQFSTDGIERTATARVARKARVAHGTLFVHYPTRDDLILAVVEEFTTRIAARIRDLELATQPNLKAVLQAHVAAIAEQEGFYARLVLERMLLPPRSRNRLVILHSAVAFMFARAVERETRSGGIRPAAPGPLFNTWIGLLHHYVCNRDLFSENGPVLAQRGDALIEHFLSLVRA
jgi:AcrR family transcriptional regulator